LTYAGLGFFSPKMSAAELARYKQEEAEMSEDKTVEVRAGAKMSASKAYT